MALIRVNQVARRDPRSPADIPVVVDLQSGALNIGFDVSPCLTRARGQSRAFFSLQHARRLSMNELCRLQGLDSREMRISLTNAQMGSLLGNAFTCTVLARVLASAIQAEEGPRAATGAHPPEEGPWAVPAASGPQAATGAPPSEEGPWASTGALPAASRLQNSLNPLYAYDTPLHNVSAIGRVRQCPAAAPQKPTLKRPAAALQEPMLRRRRLL